MSDERHQPDYFDLDASETHDEPAQVEPIQVCAYCLGNADGPASLTDFYGHHLLSFCGLKCEDAWIERASNFYQTKHENDNN